MATFRDGRLAHYRRTGTCDRETYMCARTGTPPAGPGVVLNRSRLMREAPVKPMRLKEGSTDD